MTAKMDGSKPEGKPTGAKVKSDPKAVLKVLRDLINGLKGKHSPAVALKVMRDLLEWYADDHHDGEWSAVIAVVVTTKGVDVPVNYRRPRPSSSPARKSRSAPAGRGSR